MADSILTLTFNQAKKTVVTSGLIAIREQNIGVTVIGGAALAVDLVLKIQDKSNKGKTTPIGMVTIWGASGADAVGTLNLNTSEAVAAFSESENLSCKTFNILLYTSTLTALQCNGLISIMNFPSNTGFVPTTSEQDAIILALVNRVAELEAGALTAVHQDDFGDLDFTDLGSDAKRNATLRVLLTRLQGI